MRAILAAAPVRVLTAAALCVLAAFGCDAYSERGAKGVGLIPTPQDSAQHLARYEPKRPYSQRVPGLLARSAFRSPPGLKGLSIEVEDLLVGPHQKSDTTTLGGPLVLEIKSGAGVITVNGKSEPVSAGRTLSVAGGASIAFENTGEIPLAAQAHVLVSES